MRATYLKREMAHRNQTASVISILLYVRVEGYRECHGGTRPPLPHRHRRRRLVGERRLNF